LAAVSGLIKVISLWEEWVGECRRNSQAEIIANLLTEYPDICVLNDGLHVHAAKRLTPKVTEINQHGSL